MSATIVLQSHRSPLPHAWLQACLDSVQHWAELKGYHYRFIGDELFADLDAVLGANRHAELREQVVIASDLGRLLWMRRLLAEGYERVIWCDADFLIFAPQAFDVLDANCALGREVWVQFDDQHKLRCYRKVHNAFLMFREDSALLGFYIESALRLLQQHQGGMPAQFIGPKLLTALHNVVQFPVQENAAMLSPLVIGDLLAGGGKALDLFLLKSTVLPAAGNLCSSSVERGEMADDQLIRLIEQLSSSGALI